MNLLHSRLRDTALVFKLRPLGNNPVEHTGLQFAQRRLNTESRPWICRLPPASHSLSLSSSARALNAITAANKDGLYHTSILGVDVNVSSRIYGSSLRAAMRSHPPAPGDVSARQLTSRPGKHCETDLSRASQRSPQSSRAALTSSLQRVRGELFRRPEVQPNPLKMQPRTSRLPLFPTC